MKVDKTARNSLKFLKHKTYPWACSLLLSAVCRRQSIKIQWLQRCRSRPWNTDKFSFWKGNRLIKEKKKTNCPGITTFPKRMTEIIVRIGLRSLWKLERKGQERRIVSEVKWPQWVTLYCRRLSRLCPMKIRL